MLTDERYKQLMEDVGLPNSISLLQALKQCAMEAALIERAAPVPAMPMQSAALTDDEIVKLADESRSAEPNKNGGYVLPISFARVIERAVLAKAMPMPKQEPAGAVADNGLEIAAKYIDGIGDHLEKKWKEYTETSTGGCATTFHTLYHELANEIRALSSSPRITEQDARE